jgi:hypothetical protein
MKENNISNEIHIKIKSFKDLKKINAIAISAEANDPIFVRDINDNVADAASLLGMISLDFCQPVQIKCENPLVLQTICIELNL